MLAAVCGDVSLWKPSSKAPLSAIVFGAVGTAGQRCTSTRRVIIHEDIYDEVVNALIKAYRSLRIGNPLDEGHHMGPLIDQAAVGRPPAPPRLG